jgi:hypothetical protein
MSIAGNAVTEKKLRTPGGVDFDNRTASARCPIASCTSSLIDCNDRNGVDWQLPGETRQMMFADKSTFTWLSPTDSGTSARADVRVFLGQQPSFSRAMPWIDVSDGGKRVPRSSPGRKALLPESERNGCAGVGSLGTDNLGY